VEETKKADPVIDGNNNDIRILPACVSSFSAIFPISASAGQYRPKSSKFDFICQQPLPVESFGFLPQKCKAIHQLIYPNMEVFAMTEN